MRRRMLLAAALSVGVTCLGSSLPLLDNSWLDITDIEIAVF